MKLKIKEYLYLLNDVSNVLLGKTNLNQDKNDHKYPMIITILSILLFVSVMVNVYLVIWR